VLLPRPRSGDTVSGGARGTEIAKSSIRCSSRISLRLPGTHEEHSLLVSGLTALTMPYLRSPPPSLCSFRFCLTPVFPSMYSSPIHVEYSKRAGRLRAPALRYRLQTRAISFCSRFRASSRHLRDCKGMSTSVVGAVSQPSARTRVQRSSADEDANARGRRKRKRAAQGF
jgi:hypothetical protein